MAVLLFAHILIPWNFQVSISTYSDMYWSSLERLQQKKGMCVGVGQTTATLTLREIFPFWEEYPKVLNLTFTHSQL